MKAAHAAQRHITSWPVALCITAREDLAGKEGNVGGRWTKSLQGVCGTAPRLAFSEAVSAGDWTLTDPDRRSHAIDGPVRMATNNTQMLLAAAFGDAGITYGPSFVFGQHIAGDDLVVLLPGHRTAELAIHAVYPTAGMSR